MSCKVRFKLDFVEPECLHGQQIKQPSPGDRVLVFFKQTVRVINKLSGPDSVSRQSHGDLLFSGQTLLLY